MRTLEEVREFFKNDVYASGTTGIEIEDARPGYAKVTLKIDERHINAVDRVMGAVYYTMADFAFAVATNYEYDKSATVTLSSRNARMNSVISWAWEMHTEPTTASISKPPVPRIS